MSVADLERLGDLTVLERPLGQVVFAHGIAGGHRDTSIGLVCELLNSAGLNTLAVDVLSVDERNHIVGVDMAVLSHRLATITGWLAEADFAPGVAIGYLGTGVGAATVLTAAAEPDSDIAAVVCCGGRPDLAAPALPDVRAPSLLIAAENDPEAVANSRRAAESMACDHAVSIVRSATHLFAEPDAIRKTTELARDWFVTHMERTPLR